MNARITRAGKHTSDGSTLALTSTADLSRKTYKCPSNFFEKIQRKKVLLCYRFDEYGGRTVEGTEEVQPCCPQRIRDGQRIFRTKSFRRNTGKFVQFFVFLKQIYGVL